MTRESIIELQKIDCNCSDCKFMIRDLKEFKKWELWNRDIQEKAFEKRKQEALLEIQNCKDEKGRKTLEYYYKKMKFQFDKSGLIHYGNCSKFEKKVSFIPAICQIETQSCFEHRRNNI